MTWFIADDNGDVYAHDICDEMKAKMILDDLLTAHPEYEELNLEVLNDDEEVDGE